MPTSLVFEIVQNCFVFIALSNARTFVEFVTDGLNSWSNTRNFVLSLFQTFSYIVYIL